MRIDDDDILSFCLLVVIHFYLVEFSLNESIYNIILALVEAKCIFLGIFYTYTRVYLDPLGASLHF
jgi:1,4-dihydroxy-2-naphthoate octaprenyltransferase